jgi:hypothetical protein
LTTFRESFWALLASVDTLLIGFYLSDPSLPYRSPELILDEIDLVISDIDWLLFDWNVDRDPELGKDFRVSLPVPQKPVLRLRRDHEGQASEKLLGELAGVKIGPAALEAAGKGGLGFEAFLLLVFAGGGVGVVHGVVVGDYSLFVAGAKLLLVQGQVVEGLRIRQGAEDVHLREEG